MKKILGISLVALFAVSPMMANAATGEIINTDPINIQDAEHGGNPQQANAVTTNVAPKWKLATANDTTDKNAASAGYVKGAYNAAMKAVNYVHDEVASLDSAKQDALTASSGIDIDSTTNKIKVDITANGGLTFDGEGDNATLKIAQSGVSSDEIANSSILVEDIATSAMKAGTGDYAASSALAQQGYVDEKVAGLNIGNYATKTGVENAINSVTLNVGTFQLTSGAVSGSVTVPIMDDWENPDTPASSALEANASLSVGTAINNGSVTINSASVNYEAANSAAN